MNSSSQTGKAMADEATKTANNIGQKLSAGKAEMLKLIQQQQEEATKLAGELKGVTDAGARRALGEYNKQIANLKATHAKMTEGNIQGDAYSNLMNGLKKSEVAAKQAVEKAKQAGKTGDKFVKDVARVAKNPDAYKSNPKQDTSKAQGKVKGGPMSQAERFGPSTSGGRKRRTRRKRRRKGKKSRRSRRKKRKGKKSRRSRRKKRKGRKSRRKKRRTRRRR